MARGPDRVPCGRRTAESGVIPDLQYMISDERCKEISMPVFADFIKKTGNKVIDEYLELFEVIAKVRNGVVVCFPLGL